MVQSIADDFLIEGDDATFGATTHESVNTDSASVEGPLDAESVSATEQVSANGTQFIGTYATEEDLPDPSEFDVGAEATVVSDPNGQTSVYKLVDE